MKQSVNLNEYMQEVIFLIQGDFRKELSSGRRYSPSEEAGQKPLAVSGALRRRKTAASWACG